MAKAIRKVTQSKAAPRSRAATPRRPAAATPKTSAAARRPFLRFHHPAPLRARTIAVLDLVEGSADPRKHRQALAGIVVELTACGLDTCFLQPLKLSRAGFLVEQSAGLGIAGATSVLSAVIHRVIGGMGGRELVSVCGSIRKLML